MFVRSKKNLDTISWNLLLIMNSIPKCFLQQIFFALFTLNLIAESYASDNYYSDKDKINGYNFEISGDSDGDYLVLFEKALAACNATQISLPPNSSFTLISDRNSHPLGMNRGDYGVRIFRLLIDNPLLSFENCIDGVVDTFFDNMYDKSNKAIGGIVGGMGGIAGFCLLMCLIALARDYCDKYRNNNNANRPDLSASLIDEENPNSQVNNQFYNRSYIARIMFWRKPNNNSAIIGLDSASVRRSSITLTSDDISLISDLKRG